MYVYILLCQNDSLYTGITSDPHKRLKQHLRIIKGGAKYTRIFKVKKVAALWYNQSGKYARKLEYAIKKKLNRSQKLMLINNTDVTFHQLGINIPDSEFLRINTNSINDFLKIQTNECPENGEM